MRRTFEDGSFVEFKPSGNSVEMILGSTKLDGLVKTTTATSVVLSVTELKNLLNKSGIVVE